MAGLLSHDRGRSGGEFAHLGATRLDGALLTQTVMEMHQVRYFLALCEERSFTRAARRCGVAQPSLTKAIKQLEDELGGELFNRSRSGATLSSRGATLRRHFLRIEQSIAAIRTEAEFVSSKAAIQPLWRRELAMSRNLLLCAAVLLLLLGMGGIIATAMLTGATKSEPVATIAIDPHALHLAVDVRALPEQQVKEPF